MTRKLLDPVETLQHYFGYSQFRPGQLDIIQAVLSGLDTLAILPTGGGKSLCYQIPGLILEGVTIVVSPLISLMKDQVDALQRRNISAVCITSTLQKNEIDRIYQELSARKYTFIYVAPERLQNTSFLKAVQSIKVSLVAVDEAHCLSMWGHDFRPHYLDIARFVSSIGRPPVIALTATATRQVKTDIIQHLQLDNPQFFLTTFQRTNLTLWKKVCYHRNTLRNTLWRLLAKHQGQAGIIYTLTRRKAEQVAYEIKKLQPNRKVGVYHGGLDPAERATVQERFISGQLPLITATNAFGMGVDKSDVRFVIHVELPSNLENYYQEAGRAGRDGQPADCYLLFHPADIETNLNFLAKMKPAQQAIEAAKLKKIQHYLTHSGCSMQYILSYFDEHNSKPCQNCGNCLRKSPLTENKAARDQMIAMRHRSAQENGKPAYFFLTDAQLELGLTTQNWSAVPGLGWGWHQRYTACLQGQVPALTQPAAVASASEQNQRSPFSTKILT